jgi:hypothetical protein
MLSTMNNNNNQHKNLLTTERILNFINNTPFNGCNFSVGFSFGCKILFCSLLNFPRKIFHVTW